MKTYFCNYKTDSIQKLFIVAARDQYEAEATAYASEVGTLLDGTKVYPEASDFNINEVLGCFNRVKEACVLQYL